MTTAVETARDTPFTIGGRTFQSRLMVGTGKYRDNETMVRAIEASTAPKKKASSTISIPSGSSSSPTPPAATAPTMPSATRGSDARRASTTS